MSTYVPKTIWQAMEQYASFCEKSRFSMLRTAIERYAVPGWEGPTPKKGQRVSNAAQEFLKQLPIIKLQSLTAALQTGCDLFNLNDKEKKKYRSYVKKFLSFCEESWEFSKLHQSQRKSSKNLDKDNIYRLQRTDGNPRIHQVSTTGVKRGSPFALGTQTDHFIIINTSEVEVLYYLALKCVSYVKGISALFVFETVLANQSLQQELNELANYLSHLKDAEEIMDKVLRMLGYLHQVQNIQLNELSLTKLIPFIKQIYSEADFIEDPDFERGKNDIPKYLDRVEHKLSSAEKLAKRRIKQKSKELIQWVDGFLDWLNLRQIELGNQKGSALGTQRSYITTLVTLAKYLYKAETRFKSYKDIELIEKLKERRNSLKINEQEQKNRIAARCLTWEEVAAVVEMQRRYTDTRYGVPHIKPYGIYPNKRRPSAIASNLQALIILLLLMLIPSDRQQTYRRLEFQETLKINEQIEGVFILLGEFEGEVFVPKHKMGVPEQAQWWLAIYDFKTVKKYGSFWYPIPNQQFVDGKIFYEYLEMWFFGLGDTEGKWDEYYEAPNEKWQGYVDENGQKHGWRNALNPNHSFAFSRPRTRTPHDKDSLCSLIQSIFIQFTPSLTAGKIVPVTPHSFRTMLATYTDGKLTPSEEVSMAYCEHHSVERRRTTYTIVENMKKISAAVAVMNRINQTLYLDQKNIDSDIDEAYLEIVSYLDTSVIEKIPASVLDALNFYKNFCDSNRFSMVRTAIERYAIPGWGGPISEKGKHIKFDAQAFLNNLSVVKIISIEVAIKRGCEYLEVSSRTRGKNLSYARRFLEFCKEQEWLLNLSLNHLKFNTLKSIKYFYSILKSKPELIQFSSTGISSTPAFGLGTRSSDSVCCIQTKQQILGNIELHEELSNFESYLNGSSKAKDTLYKIRQVLGYLHRIKEVSLAELRLTKIIPFIKLIYLESDFTNDLDFELNENGLPKHPEKIEQKLSIIESIAKRRSETIAKDLLHFLADYFEWLDQCRIRLGAQEGLAEGTKLDHLNAFINLAKYLYQFETHSADFSDVVVLNKLREERSKFKPEKRKQKARVGARCITWEEAIQVVEMQRELADIRHYIELPSARSNKFYLRKKKPAGVAREIQKVLLLLLMTLIPCDRQQTYRRLQFREFLKLDEQTEGAFIVQGDFLNEEFIPKSHMTRPEQSKWWLAIYEFKTIEKYGPFWYPLPNQCFADGKTFYEYLEMWFLGLEDTEGKWPQYYKGANATWQGYIDQTGKKHGWRMALRPKCNFAFFGPTSGSPFMKETLGQLIKNIFIGFTIRLERGEVVPVTPHSFRTMLATYTAGKLTFAEEESMAYCEHHSVETRRENYVLFDNMRQIADAVKVMERINNQIFGSPNL